MNANAAKEAIKTIGAVETIDTLETTELKETNQVKEPACRLDTVLLQDLLDGTIDPLEKLFVEEHLKTCRQCRQELARLKLLFWDLNDKTNYETELPPELDLIKESLLTQFTGKPAKKAAEIIIDIQRQNVRAAGMFLDYVPGVKAGNELIKKGVTAAPSALGKVSKTLIKGTKLLLAE